MFSSIKRRVLPFVAAGALVLGMAAPVAAAPPIFAGGLVTVVLVDTVDIEDNTVQVPVAAAANICGVSVEVLVADLAPDGFATCDADAGSQANN